MTIAEKVKEIVKENPAVLFRLEIQRRSVLSKEWGTSCSTSVPKDGRLIEGVVQRMRRTFVATVMAEARYTSDSIRVALVDGERVPVIVEYPSDGLLQEAYSLGDYRLALNRAEVILNIMRSLIDESNRKWDDGGETFRQIHAATSDYIGDMSRIRLRERASIDRMLDEATETWMRAFDGKEQESWLEDRGSRKENADGILSKPRKPISPVRRRAEDRDGDGPSGKR